MLTIKEQVELKVYDKDLGYADRNNYREIYFCGIRIFKRTLVSKEDISKCNKKNEKVGFN